MVQVSVALAIYFASCCGCWCVEMGVFQDFCQALVSEEIANETREEHINNQYEKEYENCMQTILINEVVKRSIVEKPMNDPTEGIKLLDSVERNNETNCKDSHATEMNNAKKRKRSIKSKKKKIEVSNQSYCQDIKAEKNKNVTFSEPRKNVAYEKYLKELLEHLHHTISMITIKKSIIVESSRNEPNKRINAISNCYNLHLNNNDIVSLDNKSMYIKYYPP